MNNKEKVLSVSVAAYNMERYLSSCLDSFLEESVLHRVEVIIIDDGSKDNTAKIAESYVNQYPNTYRLISKENGGLGSAFNIAIQEAQGIYFKWLDADDMFDTEGLVRLLDILEKTKVDILLTPHIKFEDETGRIYQSGKFYEKVEKNKILNIYDSISNWYSFHMHEVVFQTNNLREIKLLEHCFYVDVEYVGKGICASKTIMFLEVPVYLYRLSREGQSVGIEGYRKHYLEHRRVIECLLSYSNVNKQNQMVLRYLLNAIIENQYWIYCRLEISKKHFNELMEWNCFVKGQYPNFFRPGMGKKMYLVQKENYLLYSLVARHIQNQNDKSIYIKQNIKDIIKRNWN